MKWQRGPALGGETPPIEVRILYQLTTGEFYTGMMDGCDGEVQDDINLWMLLSDLRATVPESLQKHKEYIAGFEAAVNMHGCGLVCMRAELQKLKEGFQ